MPRDSQSRGPSKEAYFFFCAFTIKGHPESLGTEVVVDGEDDLEWLTFAPHSHSVEMTHDLPPSLPPGSASSSNRAGRDGPGFLDDAGLSDQDAAAPRMTQREKRARRTRILYRSRGRHYTTSEAQAAGSPNPKPYTCTYALYGFKLFREAATFPSRPPAPPQNPIPIPMLPTNPYVILFIVCTLTVRPTSLC